MRSSRAKHGPFAERVHYALDEIDRICVEALRGVGCLPDLPSPIRIDRFIEKHFGCDIGYEDFGPGILGCTIFTPAGKVQAVLVSTNLDDGTRPGERRLWSTLAHEGGHGLLHAHLFIQSTHTQDRFGFDGDQKPQDRILCRSDEIGGVEAKRSYDGKWWEYQANRAIGGFLLPKKLVEQAVRDLLQPSGTTGVLTVPVEKRDALVRHISEVFDVNPVVAKIRIGEMWPVNAGSTLL
jgi:hypothetical protein